MTRTTDWYAAGFCICFAQGWEAVLDKAQIYKHCTPTFQEAEFLRGARDAREV